MKDGAKTLAPIPPGTASLSFMMPTSPSQKSFSC